MVNNHFFMSVKRERFEKIAPKRVEKILHTLSLLSNCANPYSYEYTDEDIEKIFKAITKKVNDTRAVFNSKMSNSKFKL